MKPLKPINCDKCGKPIEDVRNAGVLYSAKAKNIRVIHKVTCDPHGAGDVWEELWTLHSVLPNVIPPHS